jgi:N-acyl-D-aspartate/D-glutamate deacylase
MADQTYDLLIINGIVVTAEHVQKADIAIKGEIVVAIGDHGTFDRQAAKRLIDAEGGWVMPGGIVCHPSFLELDATTDINNRMPMYISKSPNYLEKAAVRTRSKVVLGQPYVAVQRP